MKYFYIIFFVPWVVCAQDISIINLQANDLVYSQVSSRLYASVPSGNGANSTSLVEIDPSISIVTEQHLLTDDPTVLAISSNGLLIYGGLLTQPSVLKFDVSGSSPPSYIQLGSDFYTGNFLADDIAVHPNLPNTIAVVRKNSGHAPRYEGIVVYDNDIARLNTAIHTTPTNRIEFKPDGALIGFDSETTGTRFKKLNLTAPGVSQSSGIVITEMMGAKDFSTHGSLAFFNNGSIVNYSATSVYSGNFEGANGPSMYDAALDLVCYAVMDPGVFSLKFYDPETKALVHQEVIDEVTSLAQKITMCGSGCYAVATSDGKIVIVNNLLKNPEATKRAQVHLYPNPAYDAVEIFSEAAIDDIRIFSVLGQQIPVKYLSDDRKTIETSDWQSGTYLIHVESDGSSVVRSLIIR